MENDFVCNHIARSVHAPVRCCLAGDEIVIEKVYCECDYEDPLITDQELLKRLVKRGNAEYPVIHMETYPIYYTVIVKEKYAYITGPVCVEYGRLSEARKCIISQHRVSRNFRISYCAYEKLCEETLLLFHLITGKCLSYQELNEKNYMSPAFEEKMKRNVQHVLFGYRENEKIHNPYTREVREMESIKRGDEQQLIQSLNESFIGEYAVLSKNELQSAKNLAIVGLAISARAAIEGGIPFEEAFSMNDSYILSVDRSDHIGEIEAMVRDAKIKYVRMVHALCSSRQKNEIVEQCKNMIFRKLHSKIVIQELADELHVTPEYLSKLFHQIEGVTINAYIMRQKVQLAKNMLIYSDISVGEIATYLGFCSQSHMGKIFKEIEQMTPAQYRKRYKK